MGILLLFHNLTPHSLLLIYRNSILHEMKTCWVYILYGIAFSAISDNNSNCHGNTSFSGSYDFWVLYIPNPCIDLIQSFRIFLSHEERELIRFWVTSANKCCIGNHFPFLFKFVSFLHSKPLNRFCPKFQVMFAEEAEESMLFGKFVLAKTVAMGILFLFFFLLVILWVFYIQNLCTEIKHIFRVCLSQGELELISFLAIPGNNCCYGNTFPLFLGLVILCLLCMTNLLKGGGRQDREEPS